MSGQRQKNWPEQGVLAFPVRVGVMLQEPLSKGPKREW
jgi:hypothetical protein